MSRWLWRIYGVVFVAVIGWPLWIYIAIRWNDWQDRRHGRPEGNNLL